MFMEKIYIFSLLLFCIHVQVQASTGTDNNKTPSAEATSAAPPTKIAIPSPPATPLTLLNACICLRDPATDNLIKNCTRQQRKNENQPRIFCFDVEGIMIEQKNVQTWQQLPADHPDCTPCQDNQPATTDRIPRSGD
ncbi:hypothetical protein QUF61_06405 [Candidatus Venteria ishoeyi]|uniref:hypothetical protein n=1 Tax=Candidatus Venteria ishoeyi TaxID=1899563 RepID=UPI0025A5CEB5|nr:hypothetical protein [Candidatus Venteria ishoeyi]MDM8546108.1 hypothetical protein [Candidatus Venteria ishoeyi]